jgi:hypothetical protein
VNTNFFAVILNLEYTRGNVGGTWGNNIYQETPSNV